MKQVSLSRFMLTHARLSYLICILLSASPIFAQDDQRSHIVKLEEFLTFERLDGSSMEATLSGCTLNVVEVFRRICFDSASLKERTRVINLKSVGNFSQVEFSDKTIVSVRRKELIKGVDFMSSKLDLDHEITICDGRVMKNRDVNSFEMSVETSFVIPTTEGIVDLAKHFNDYISNYCRS